MADIEISIDSDYDGRDADHAREDLKGLGDEAKRSSEKLKANREQADANTAALRRLGDQAKSVRAEMARLTAEYGKGNDEALEGLKEQDKKLREIETQTRRVIKVEQDRTRQLREMLNLGGGGGGRGRGGGGIMSLLGGLGGGAGRAGGGGMGIPSSPVELAILGLLAQLAAPAVPLAGGGLVAGAAGGVIGGALAVGAAGAIADDPALYESKWVGAIERVSRRWQDASDGFGAPILRSIDKIEGALDDVPLERILGNASKFVDPLVTAFTTVITGAGAAVDKVIQKAGPYINELQEELPELGHDLETIGQTLANASEGGAQALGDLLDVVGFLAKGFTGLAGSAAQFWESLREGDPAPFLEFWGKIIGGEPAGDIMSAIVGFITEPLEGAEEQAKETAAALDELFNTMLDADDANLAVKESWTSLKEELKDGKRTLDDNTAAGQENRRSILGHIEALEAQRQANIAAGQDQATANAKFYEGVAAVKALLTQLGFAPGEIDKIIAKWLELYRLPDIRKSYTLYANYEGFRENMDATAGKRGQSRGNNAAGGPAEAWSADGGTWMNEFGWEAVKLPNGSMVLPSPNAAREVAALGGGGSSGGTRIEVLFDPSSSLGAIFLAAQQRGEVQVLASSIVDA